MIKLPQVVLQEIKSHLESERKRVSAQITDLSIQDPFADTGRVNDNAASDTEASEESDHERLQALIAELKSKLEAIEAALERIKKGTYGICQTCGNLIDTDRLAAMPTALLCMDCEAKKKK